MKVNAPTLFPELRLRAQIQQAVTQLGPDRAFDIIARVVEAEIRKYPHDEATATIHSSAKKPVEPPDHTRSHRQ